MVSNSRMQITLLSFLFKKFNIIKKGISINNTLKLYAVLFSCFIHAKGQRPSGFTVDAMEVLIKYCMNSFPQVDQFILIQISFYFLCVSYWSIGSEMKPIGSSKSNRKLINFLSNELINLRKGIGAIFYQHFHCIDSKAIMKSIFKTNLPSLTSAPFF
jgi:hypothetical protein